MSGQDFGRPFLSHLADVVQGTASLNRDTVDHFRRLLPASPGISKQERVGLALKLYEVLPAIHDDPTPINELIQALLEGCPLEDILQIEPPIDLAAGLDVRAKPFNLLALSILAKGLLDIAPARRLAATRPEIFSALVRLWFLTEDAAVATACQTVLWGLLKADRELDGSGILPSQPDDPTGLSSPADSPIWKRIFRDPDIYAILYDATSLKDSTFAMSKSQRTLAQARLMDLLSNVGKLDWTALSGAHIPDIEARHGLGPDQGLLHYAALHMVDHKHDVLMHRSLINFFQELLAAFATDEYATNHSNPSPALAFLIDNGLHQRTLRLYTRPESPSHDPLDIAFLYSAAGSYVRMYCATSPRHFEASQATRAAVFGRLKETLDVPGSRWLNSPPEFADIRLLTGLPPQLLMPSVTSDSPILYLPTRPPTSEVFAVLSKLFSAASNPEVPGGDSDRGYSRVADRTAPRNLYLAYLHHHPRMWQDIVEAADTVAMKDAALSAINVIQLVAEAAWPGYSRETGYSASEDIMSDSTEAPQTGIEALVKPPALTAVLPYLLRQPQTFANLAGGRGDAEGAAYQVAAKKFDCTVAIHNQLKAWIEAGGAAIEERRDELRRIEAALGERIAEGVWGSRGDVGGRIATLEL